VTLKVCSIFDTKEGDPVPSTREQRLRAKVKAVNRANTFANALHPILKEYFAPYVGCKVIKSDGQLLKKIEDKLPKLPFSLDVGIRWYRSVTTYSLLWNVSVSESVDETSCLYHEVGIYVGELEGDTLKSLSEISKLRTDYDFDTIKQLMQEAKAAEKAFDEAKGKVGIFQGYEL
jgi:hypothetical protein